MPVWLTFVIASLACFRVTRLIVEDTWPPAEWLRKQAERGPYWFGYLFTCGHCMSVWVGAVIVAVMWAVDPLPLPGLWFAAVPALVSLIYSVRTD